MTICSLVAAGGLLGWGPFKSMHAAVEPTCNVTFVTANEPASTDVEAAIMKPKNSLCRGRNYALASTLTLSLVFSLVFAVAGSRSSKYD